MKKKLFAMVATIIMVLSISMATFAGPGGGPNPTDPPDPPPRTVICCCIDYPTYPTPPYPIIDADLADAYPYEDIKLPAYLQ